MGLDKTTLLRLQIAAGDGGEIDVEASGELALGRQAIGRSEAPAADVFVDGIGNGEVARLVAGGEVWCPVLHLLRALWPIVMHPGIKTRSTSIEITIDCILLRA